jgi:hypothetical protein
MMRSRCVRWLIGAACVLLPSASAAAQGTLSTQGLGFSPGQLSTPARTMGGAMGEADPLSPLNPASIGLLTATLIFMQAEPEFREVLNGAQKERTSVARFPLFLGAMPLGSRWTVAVSASTLLDRTWVTSTRDTQTISGVPQGADVVQKSDGSIADLRLAVAFATTSWLRIGIAGHAYSGRADLRTSRTFDDTASFEPDTVFNTVGFGGNAISIGAQSFWPRYGAIGVTYRRGGSFRTYSNGQPVDQASAPDHFGLSAVYLGIRGTTLAARIATDSWSRMQGLSSTLQIHEGMDLGVGADVTGPRFGSSPISLRAGVRWRTLPFSATGRPVDETTLSGGFGLPMANNRVEINVGALRASRRDGGSVSENAWTISTGFAVRP